MEKKKYSTKSSAEQQAEKRKCRRCDKIHESGKCPAYGLECYKCKGKNHFAKCCISERTDRKKKVRTERTEQEENQEQESQESYMDSVDIDQSTGTVPTGYVISA